MGKPSKKSATKVEAAPPAAVVPVSKSGKKGKREAGNEIEKAVSAKKQKKDVAVVQAIEKTKAEAKTPKKKKVEESSSSEEEDSDESSSEDEKPAPKAATVPAKKQVAAAKKAESSSSEESSSDEESEDEKPAPKAAPAKNGTVAKKVESSESSESSDEESDEDEAPKPKAAAAKAPQAVTKTVKESSSSEESIDEESEDDDETPAKVTAAPAAKKVAPAPAKKAEASSSSEESDSDEEDDSEESSDVEDAKPKKAAPAAKAPAKAAKKESSSEESEDEDSSEEESSEEDEPAKTPKKNDTDVEMVDAETKSAKKASATPATPDVSTSKTLFAGNLSFRIEQSDVEEFFKECGEVVDVRFASDQDGQFKGFGHVEFATAEAAKKALELNGGDLAGRPVRLDLARERGEKGAYTPQSGKENSYQRGGGQGQSQTLFVRGFDTSEGEDKIREALQNHFAACGEMTRCSIPPDRDTGAVKGMAYIDFADPSGMSKALELDGSDIGGGCYLTVNEAKPREPRGDFGGGRGRFDSGGRGRGRGRFDSGGRGGGRFDSGGRRGGGRFDSGGRRGGGRGGFNKPNLAAAGTGKKTTFNNDD